ncbi:MAG: helix-turn-helix transcriptional regulator [Candidatus Thermoplasmatota archaeon]
MKRPVNKSLLVHFGDRLRQLRQQKGLTQSQLAKKVHVGHRTILLYERGEMTPSIDVVTRVARFFEVGLDDLVFNDARRCDAVRDRDLIDCLIQADRLPRKERALIKDLVEVLAARCNPAGHPSAREPEHREQS